MDRLTDIAVAKIREAIGALLVPQAVKDEIRWEIVPMVGPGSFAFVLVLVVPVPGSRDDHALYLDARQSFGPLDDQPSINDLVRNQVYEAQYQADQLAANARAQANGHKTTPGGLAIP